MKTRLPLLLLLLLGAQPTRAQQAPDTITQTRYLAIHPWVVSDWAWHEKFWKEVEWGACLYGHVSGDTTYIDRSEPGFITRASMDRITHGCRLSGGYVGHVHLHLDLSSQFPDTQELRCTWSPEDKVRNPIERVAVIVCGPDRFSFKLYPDTATHLQFMPPLLKKKSENGS